MTRSMEITFVVIIFSLVATMVSQLGIFQYTNDMNQVNINQSSINEITGQSEVQPSGTDSGYWGFFNIGVKVISMIGNIVLGLLVVAVPLYNLGVPIEICVCIQGILYALVAFDQLSFWRGQPW